MRYIVKYNLRRGPIRISNRRNSAPFRSHVIPAFSLLSHHPRKMSSKSRWADDDPETKAIIAQQKREKEQKRHAKAEKQRQLAEATKAQQARQETDTQAPNGESGPPQKRRRLSIDAAASTTEVAEADEKTQSSLMRFPIGEWGPCRHVDNFERLNHIEEGSYGWVSRAKDISTGEIVALKKLKLENSPDGFPVTGLREIQTLLEARHENVVYLREVVMGNKLDE